jgi:hypothetical protein
MNVRGLSNSAIKTVNADTLVSIQPSSGYTIGSGARQIPSYGTAVSQYANIQELTVEELRLIEGLNIQGTKKTIYTHFLLRAASRPNQTGGDLITFNEQKWLVVKILEQWNEWTKALIVQQVS